MKLSATITIPRPRLEVFDFITDVSNMPKWVSGVTAARLVSAEMARGARFVCDYRPAMRSEPIELEVVTFDPPESFCTKSRRGPFQFEGCVTLADSGDGTSVTNTIEAGPDSLSTRLATMLLGPILRRSMQRRLYRELTALEHAVAK